MNRAAGDPRDVLTLGLLAGGQALRLGGRDKAWLARGGQPQVLRLLSRYAGSVATTLVSANRGLSRYADAGLVAVPDARPGAGPLSGLHALAAACTTPWLFTLPVDVVDVPEDLLPCLLDRRAGNGAWVRDADGPQPLVALWRVAALRAGIEVASAAGEIAIQALHARLSTEVIDMPGTRLGNLNTPADLEAAGVDPEPMSP